MDLIAQAQSFVVRQKKEMVEILLNWESNNRYEIYDHNGRMLFYALETTGCCDRYFCQRNRAFHVKFIMNGTINFLEMQADLNCCGQNIDIECPVGQHFGSVRKPFALCRPTFELKDATHKTIFRIPTPCSAVCCKCCADVEIPIYALDGTPVGEITKQWGGFFKEAFTDADTFGVTFKPGIALSPQDKTLILASVFPIDFAFYERSSREDNSIL